MDGIDRFKWQRPFTKGKFASAILCVHFGPGILSMFVP